jgi:hypothetical protein
MKAMCVDKGTHRGFTLYRVYEVIVVQNPEGYTVCDDRDNVWRVKANLNGEWVPSFYHVAGGFKLVKVVS